MRTFIGPFRGTITYLYTNNIKHRQTAEKKVIKKCEESSDFRQKRALFYSTVISFLYEKLNVFMLGLSSFLVGNFWRIIYTNVIMCDYG